MGRGCSCPSPPTHPPSKSHDLALSTAVKRAAILALENSSWKKACHLMTATFPLFKLHSSNSHVSYLLPKTGSPFVGCFFFFFFAGRMAGMGNVYLITEWGGPVIKEH